MVLFAWTVIYMYFHNPSDLHTLTLTCTNIALISSHHICMWCWLVNVQCMESCVVANLDGTYLDIRTA
jgi:hypothetical protein